MEIVHIQHVEDCFDGSLIREVQLNAPITERFVYFLGEGGVVQYFANFPRPFFKVRQPDMFDLKGIGGNITMRVHLKSPDSFTVEDLCRQVRLFQNES